MIDWAAISQEWASWYIGMLFNNTGVYDTLAGYLTIFGFMIDWAAI